MKTLMTGLMMSGMAASAFAAPLEVDSRAVTQGDTSARLVRFHDGEASCADFGVLTVIDRTQKTLAQKNICGAANILSARQGDESVIYVYARDAQGALGLYRYIVDRDAWDFYDFKASELRVISMGTEIMVQAFYAPLAGDVKPVRESWTWHPRFDAPKKI